MSDPGHQRALFKGLPSDVRSLARIIHGLGIYDVVAKDFYGCDLSEERRREIHIRSMEKWLSTGSPVMIFAGRGSLRLYRGSVGAAVRRRPGMAGFGG
jgi:hypothetical protein